ncbi:hypothetical protein NC652_032524 [Populus alba x Populus x berolinensis]|nr:hypothetical protein NC652_032524 [Populus alba x Populus x berolinensis]
MRSGQHWTMIIKQAMEANRIELDPSGQVLEGRTIAGEISSVNHRTPCPSAPPIEGRVKSNDQKRQSKRDTDKRYNVNRKQKEDEIMKEVESLEKISGELESEYKELQRQEKQWEVNIDKEYGKIVSQLEDNNAGQNTDVQGASAHADFPIANADINTTGEISMGHEGHKREMNQAPITSNLLLLLFFSVSPLLLYFVVLCWLQLRPSILGWKWGLFCGRCWRRNDYCWPAKKLGGGGLLQWRSSPLRR